MRGKWIVNLSKRIHEKKIRLSDGIGFVISRFRPKPTDIFFHGIQFEQADHTLWGLIADIFINQEYTPPGFEIHPNDIVVDIGGHRGVFTAFASLCTENTILVFEPQPDNFSRLKSLVEKHNWHNVKANNIAISDIIGEIELFIGKTDSRNSIIGKDVVTSEELTDSIVVPSTTLENTLVELPVIDFLKMDCEGAEFSILLNCADKVFDKINKIALEYHANEDSPELTKLVTLLELHYKEVVAKQLPGVPLGYIYARK
jgi:FkbM family methyltransferase